MDIFFTASIYGHSFFQWDVFNTHRQIPLYWYLAVLFSCINAGVYIFVEILSSIYGVYILLEAIEFEKHYIA